MASIQGIEVSPNEEILAISMGLQDFIEEEDELEEEE